MPIIVPVDDRGGFSASIDVLARQMPIRAIVSDGPKECWTKKLYEVEDTIKISLEAQTETCETARTKTRISFGNQR